ncbi:MOSC domain-containing protein [Teichococcus oryzae]|uniref:MOSC domain-containing protein n=1 Tax=Teichococcus oryzae TaxID=1608942 RepID=A0A5B2TCC5_9PROT|nr:MOSC domain-containing protein [Pseudoroseomonas oryzae]KAA2211498.1 MOSC domain-containing protein [Pseudoroseomonas oryzae]
MIGSAQPVVLTGQVAPLGPGGVPSGIDKHPVPGPWRISRAGIAGDAQGDLRHHGGPEKALHQYPFEHYATWAAEIGDHPLLAKPGAFGENLSASGWTEGNICIGDIVRFGTSLLQVSQGRQPCFKLGLRFGHRGMARALQHSGRTGWYWRVLEEGTAEMGNALLLIERPQPDWPLSRLNRLLYKDTGNRDALAAMARLPELAQGWRMLAERRLASGTVEDWSKRLNG